jgi:hypothetical protein
MLCTKGLKHRNVISAEKFVDLARNGVDHADQAFVYSSGKLLEKKLSSPETHELGGKLIAELTANMKKLGPALSPFGRFAPR